MVSQEMPGMPGEVIQIGPTDAEWAELEKFASGWLQAVRERRILGMATVAVGPEGVIMTAFSAIRGCSLHNLNSGTVIMQKDLCDALTAGRGRKVERGGN